jgi:hypothetical protein
MRSIFNLFFLSAILLAFSCKPPKRAISSNTRHLTDLNMKQPEASKSKTKSSNIKRELQDKERAMADQAVELAILRKKTNGGSWDR